MNSLFFFVSFFRQAVGYALAAPSCDSFGHLVIASAISRKTSVRCQKTLTKNMASCAIVEQKLSLKILLRSDLSRLSFSLSLSLTLSLSLSLALALAPSLSLPLPLSHSLLSSLLFSSLPSSALLFSSLLFSSLLFSSLLFSSLLLSLLPSPFHPLSSLFYRIWPSLLVPSRLLSSLGACLGSLGTCLKGLGAWGASLDGLEDLSGRPVWAAWEPVCVAWEACAGVPEACLAAWGLFGRPDRPVSAAWQAWKPVWASWRRSKWRSGIAAPRSTKRLQELQENPNAPKLRTEILK